MHDASRWAGGDAQATVGWPLQHKGGDQLLQGQEVQGTQLCQHHLPRQVWALATSCSTGKPKQVLTLKMMFVFKKIQMIQIDHSGFLIIGKCYRQL